MVYLVNYDTYTIIPETTGTIQNGDTLFDLELNIFDQASNAATKITLNPSDLQAFTGKSVKIRCLEPGATIPAYVVPFVVRKVQKC